MQATRRQITGGPAGCAGLHSVGPQEWPVVPPAAAGQSGGGPVW